MIRFTFFGAIKILKKNPIKNLPVVWCRRAFPKADDEKIQAHPADPTG